MERAEINRRCAILAGWEIDERGMYWKGPKAIAFVYLEKHLPDYCTDRNAIAELEKAIEARGLEYAYAAVLWSLATDKPPPSHPYITLDLWTVRTAAPEQCAEAALRAAGMWEEG